MSTVQVSAKANMSKATGHRYYRRCLKDQSYTVDDKVSLRALKKANMSEKTGHQYLKDHNLDTHIRKRLTQDQKNALIGYIVHDKMSLRAASRKTDMACSRGHKFYHQYLEDHNLDTPIPKRLTQDQKNALIGYIVNDKMSIRAASRKANMAYSSGHKFYHQYLNDQKA
jgi:hypothetical protein